MLSVVYVQNGCRSSGGVPSLPALGASGRGRQLRLTLSRKFFETRNCLSSATSATSAASASIHPSHDKTFFQILFKQPRTDERAPASWPCQSLPRPANAMAAQFPIASLSANRTAAEQVDEVVTFVPFRPFFVRSQSSVRPPHNWPRDLDLTSPLFRSWGEL